MRRLLFFLAVLTFLTTISIAAEAQQTYTISGIVKNSLSKDIVPAVSVIIKGTNIGTFTDERGNFKITSSQAPPFTLVFTSIGYEPQEVIVTSTSAPLQVSFEPASSLGAEVVVSASRVAERILESPVSIERMSAANVRASAAPNFYQGIANLKGVDMTTSSITFNTISTRGFNGSGNLRFNQLVDGMDNQAPALNFAVGIILGPTELDVDNVELLQGASSALYGPGGMNGTLLMTSKNPFKYQGLSFQVKQGIMHTDRKQRSAAPYYDWAFRWGKKLSEKFAFKIGGQFIQAKDWQAQDRRNLNRNNVLSSVKEGTRASDHNYDGINVYGDEASASMAGVSQLAILNPASNPYFNTAVTELVGMLGRAPTAQEIVGYFAQYPLQGSPRDAFKMMGVGLVNGFYGNQLVSRTGYDESDIVDYNSYSVRLNGGLYYKITNDIEASLVAYWGTGTTVYTGADRYALKNFKLGQYKAEVRGRNFFVRGYTTQENSGDSYTATTAALAVNNAWLSNSEWFATYSATYAAARAQGAPDAVAHMTARAGADQNRALPGSDAFKEYFDKAISTDINSGGAKFADKSSLYHVEGQYNFSEHIKLFELVVGANYRSYHLNSNGTIFVDTAGTIKIDEYGGYVQVAKKMFNDVLKLTASGRYDKSKNFEGRFTPRVTALIQVAKDNNLRLSYQNAYRFPSTQDQYINLKTPGARLIGGLPSFQDYFNFDTNPVYTAESIGAYRAALAAGQTPPPLEEAPFAPLKPETANSYEFGYRGLPVRKLLIDAYVYYCEYKDFIGRRAVGRAIIPNGIGNPLTTENFSYPENSFQKVKAIGWGFGFDYLLPKRYSLKANISGDQLNDVPANFVTFFNTPKVRYNIGLSNDGINNSNWGFNVLFRWQSKVDWEGTFASGQIPAFSTLDAQISYKFPAIRSMIKLGASNLLNKYYVSALGNPEIGGVYYLSFGYNVF
ncbi:TonB-dependent receptor [Pseudoflavitalea rhizosphaerae]|uniref:TonB-dependent receptor n=1 Tax=Pseudoflavitalea rhizosphaerae TaxID=1884793 RepID=UPI000F8EF889|nr:TonB-dependent receptor [Pseudoflavitalea rhizosphaerae]